MLSCYSMDLAARVLRTHTLSSRKLQLILVAQVLLTVGCGQAFSASMAC